MKTFSFEKKMHKGEFEYNDMYFKKETQSFNFISDWMFI